MHVWSQVMWILEEKADVPILVHLLLLKISAIECILTMYTVVEPS